MNTYFVTDAHFGSRAFKNTLENEKKLVRWMDGIKSDCEALYMMGDMIDFWFEYKLVVPKGFARFFGKIAEFTDGGIPVYWFAGNHDIWLFNYVQKEFGVTVYNEPIIKMIHGKKFYMAHGDGLGDPSVQFKLLLGIFRSPVCQKLFGLLPPRIGLGFGMAWAKNSRLKCEFEPEVFLGEEREYLVQHSKKMALEAGDDAPDYFVYGHRHILLDLMISKKSRIIIPGDWIHLYSYGMFDGKDFSLHLFEEK
jgi:UDP-2,3-diacylglucosamine hydrolase